jgi:hypothetical protein
MNRQMTKYSARLLRGICWLAAGFALAYSAQPARAQALLKPFSADQIHIVNKKTTTGKVMALENAVCVEGENKGKRSITITRFDRNVMWTLMPDQKMYMEMPFQGLAEMASTIKGATAKRESLGSEQVGAYHCDKARVETTYEGKVYVSIEWAAKELDGFVVKKSDEKGSWSTEYQNVQIGPQDPSLFEIPAGYQKFSLGGLFQRPNQ